jgi:NhaA family Na+:H+ antiporter
VALGVAIGLALGKPIGITAATWIGLKLNVGSLPRRTTMRTVAGLGALAGIGFTVSLFITDLAFRETLFGDEAKLGIFLGSVVSGAIGFMVLRSLKSPDEEYAVHANRLAATGEVV